MTNELDEIVELQRQSTVGESGLFDALLAKHRDRLKRTVALRMDNRLLSRLDPSDVVQETHLSAFMRLNEFLEDPQVPFFIWLRFITMQKLVEIHRRHLDTKARDTRRDVSLDQFYTSDRFELPLNLSGSATTPSESAMRNERLANLEVAMSNLDRSDRELIVMRHFEELTNLEVAHTLRVTPSAVSQRMSRALRRLRDELCKISDDFDKS